MSDVTLEEKRNFLYWFRSNYQLKSRRAFWFLNELMENDDLLRRTRFVPYCELSKYGLSVSAFTDISAPFVYIDNGYKIEDEKEGYERLQQFVKENKNELLDVDFKFPHRTKMQEYVSVLEEVNTRNKNKKMKQNGVGLEMESFLKMTTKTQEIVLIKKEIDISLDERNKHRFYELSSKLNELLTGQNKIKRIQ
jgi:uncharacterized protein YpiB (UPF0302 family)